MVKIDKGIIRWSRKNKSYRLKLWRTLTLLVVMMLITSLPFGARALWKLFQIQWIEYLVHDGENLNDIISVRCRDVINAEFKTIEKNILYKTSDMKEAMIWLPVKK